MDAARYLIVVADDYGIGPATSAGILRLARRGVVTASVLLVNSPHAPAAVEAWRAADPPTDLGWHPNLTLDAPVAPAGDVPSLVDRDGRLPPLGAFLRRWLLGRLRPAEIDRELTAQLRRFRDLVGGWPPLVNTHQHVGLFPPVGAILADVLRRHGCRPYVRRVREPWGLLARVPGARVKRAALNLLGRRLARFHDSLQLPGNAWLAGVTDPPWVRDADFFARWLRHTPGRVVELMCHPGDHDPTLVGRDCRPADGLQQRRVDELALLEQPAFREAVRAAGFVLVSPSQLPLAGETHAPAA
jgi:hypothetical protein